jgi:hypothetical protein
MYDAGKIVPGLIAFLGVVGLPFWWGLATGAEPKPLDIPKPAGEERCIEDTDLMRREHMQMLATWRDDVVRSAQRVYVASNGRRFSKSLTGTCLGCHTDRKASCTRCHDHLNVQPYCWDCHVDPEGGR